MAGRDRITRRVARLLALALVVGGLLTALPSAGLAGLFQATDGYVDTKVEPDCGKYAQTINGDVVRACSDWRNTSYGYFIGHDEWPLSRSNVDLWVSLPNDGRTFNCCSRNTTYSSWSYPSFDPVTVGNPTVGVARTTAPGYLSLTRTVRVAAGQRGYTLIYAITNTRGADVRIRPLAYLNHYGYSNPTVEPTTGGRSFTLRDPDWGGAVAFSESRVDGAEAVRGYLVGGWNQRVSGYVAPAGPALPSQLFDDRTWNTQVAYDWPAITLKAGEVRRYAVQVALSQPRDLVLRLAGARPTTTAPTAVDVAITDDRSLAGKVVRWVTTGKGQAAGAAAINAAGRASISIPAVQGYQRLRAFVDVDGDAVEDADEQSSTATIWTPAPPPPPVPTTQPVVVVPPPPPPPAPVPQKIVFTLAYDYKVKGRFTTLPRLVVKGVPKGATVTAKCKKGCAAKSLTKRNASGTVSLAKLVKRRLKAGTKITVVVSQAGKVTATKTLTIRKSKRPSVK